MKKRYIFMLLILVGTVTQFLLDTFLVSSVPSLISYLLLVPFYLIVYLFYSKNKTIRYICFIAIFTVMADIFMLGYLDQYSLHSDKIVFIARISYFGSILNIFLAFLLILQVKPRNKVLKGSFFFIALTNWIFFSYYVFSFLNLIISFFGTADQEIQRTVFVFNIVMIVMQFLIMIAQMIIVYILDKEEEDIRLIKKYS